MALKTAKEYIDSLRELGTRVYMFGEKVDNCVDHPLIRPSINCIAMTYALAHDERYKDLMTTTSHLTGRTINRFCHVHQSSEDLVKKVKMLRLIGQKTASCFQRCVGMDAFNAVYSTTYEVDEKYGTHYHENFKNFLIMVQDEDLVVDGAMTDPKGDRSLPPHAQPDPDLFLRVVERREDGIVVRGAKAHQTGSINSHWHLFMPTIAMGEADKDYALSFACPSNAEGIYISTAARAATPASWKVAASTPATTSSAVRKPLLFWTMSLSPMSTSSSTVSMTSPALWLSVLQAITARATAAARSALATFSSVLLLSLPSTMALRRQAQSRTSSLR